jgi:predicted secreted protein
MGVKLGLEAKLYRNGGDYDAPAWSEVQNVKDVTLNLEAGEADVTTRGNGGWKAVIAALKDASLEFEMVWDAADMHFAAIRQAFLTSAAIEFAVLDGDLETAGSQGLRASMAITNFSRSEPLEEAIKVSVTAKPTYAEHPPEWMTTS